MATTTDERPDMTVAFEVDGKRSDPIPLDEFEDRADAAIDRLRGRQLSFDIGAPRRSEPDFATLKIAGQLGVARDLLYQQNVTVTVTDNDGEVIATSAATIGWPAFKDKTSGELTFTERAHTATLE